MTHSNESYTSTKPLCNRCFHAITQHCWDIRSRAGLNLFSTRLLCLPFLATPPCHLTSFSLSYHNTVIRLYNICWEIKVLWIILWTILNREHSVIDRLNLQYLMTPCFNYRSWKPKVHNRETWVRVENQSWTAVIFKKFGSFNIWRGTINAGKYLQVLEWHMLPSRSRSLQEKQRTDQSSLKWHH